MPNTVTRSACAMSHRMRAARARAPRRRRARRSRRPRGGDEPVPHHPAAGREVEDPVVGAEVGVQDQLLEVLEERAARAVHHALGQAGRAGRVHDVQRMIERERGRRTGRVARAGGQRRTAPTRPPSGAGSESGRIAKVRHHDHPLDARDPWQRLRAPARANRSPCPHSGSRRRRTAPSARSGRSGRARRSHRSPASTTTRRRRGSRSRAWRRPSPADWAGSPPPGRRRRHQRPAAPRPRARPRGPARRRSGSALAAALVPEDERLVVVASRSRFSAKLSRAPVNQRGPRSGSGGAIRSNPTAHVVPLAAVARRSATTPVNRQSSGQNSSGRSTDQR